MGEGHACAHSHNCKSKRKSDIRSENWMGKRTKATTTKYAQRRSLVYFLMNLNIPFSRTKSASTLSVDATLSATPSTCGCRRLAIHEAGLDG